MNTNTQHTPGFLFTAINQFVKKGEHILQIEESLIGRIITKDVGEDQAKANAARIVECWNSHDQLQKHNTLLREALEAIVARINGEWDNKALLTFSDLSISKHDDIERIVKAVLKQTEQ